jgi:hypothetical protein
MLLLLLLLGEGVGLAVVLLQSLLASTRSSSSDKPACGMLPCQRRTYRHTGTAAASPEVGCTSTEGSWARPGNMGAASQGVLRTSITSRSSSRSSSSPARWAGGGHLQRA